MTDMVFAPAFADIDSEREVVLEEIAMIEDSPQELIHDLITEAVFGDHPLGRPVLGSADVIERVTKRSIAAYHRSRYTAGNVVVAAAGSIDHEELVGLVERMSQKLAEPPSRKPSARAPFVAPPPPSLRFERKSTEQYHVCLAAPGIARSDKRRFTASILDGVLGGSASSRLFQEIRENAGARVLRVHVLLAVRRHRPDRRLRRHEGGEPARVPRDLRRADPRDRSPEICPRKSSSARRRT